MRTKPQERTTALVQAGLRMVSRGPGFRLPMKMLDAITRLGKEGAAPVPPQLLPMGARVLAQGYLNRVALPLLDGWLLPAWMREQSDPASPFFIPRSVHNLLVNQTQRNWTALGIPGYGHPIESLVDRWGLLTPIPGGPSLDWWVEVEGSGTGIMCASGQNPVLQRLQGGLPVVVTAFEAGGVRVHSECWMLPLEGQDWAAMQVVIFNIADLPVTGTFRFALRPYNPEGIAPLYDIEYDGRTLKADGRRRLLTWPRPDGWRLSSLRQGDLFANQGAGTRERKLTDPQGLAHGVLEFSFSIEPWEEAEFLAFMPVSRHDPRRVGPGGRLFNLPSRAERDRWPKPLPHPVAYSRAKAATTLEWRRLLEGGTRLTLPDRDLQESWEANRGHLLALHDGASITPGPDLYHSYWIRDAAVMAYALSAFGYEEATRQLLLGFLEYQHKNGAFISQSGEWDGTGQALWALCRHISMYNDKALLSRVKPALEKGARWLTHTLDTNGGLLPPGLSSEHFGPPDRYYWDDLWALGGLESLYSLTEEGWLDRACQRLRTHLLESWDKAARGDALPGAPGRPTDLSAVGTLVGWYPLGLFSPANPYLKGTLAGLEKLFYEGALFMNTGHSGWGTYVNMRLAGCYTLLGSKKGWDLMRWLMKHASPTYNWPEAINARTGGGSTGDGHHGWASAGWLLLVRSLLLREEGASRIHIAPCLPGAWFESAGRVEVVNARTLCGPLSYTMEWEEGQRCLHMEVSDGLNPDAQVIWTPPPGAGRVTVNGEQINSRANVELPAGQVTVEFRREG